MMCPNDRAERQGDALLLALITTLVVATTTAPWGLQWMALGLVLPWVWLLMSLAMDGWRGTALHLRRLFAPIRDHNTAAASAYMRATAVRKGLATEGARVLSEIEINCATVPIGIRGTLYGDDHTPHPLTPDENAALSCALAGQGAGLLLATPYLFSHEVHAFEGQTRHALMGTAQQATPFIQQAATYTRRPPNAVIRALHRAFPGT